MVGYDKASHARIGFYSSIISGFICLLYGLLMIRWLYSLFLLGVLIIFTALLQRMTYKTLASSLTVLFSTIYLILWWLLMGGLSLVFNLQFGAFIGASLGIIGGAISLRAVRASLEHKS